MVPKVLGFFIVLVKDSLTSRHLYRVVLRLILATMMFYLPIYYLFKIKNKYVPHFCDHSDDLDVTQSLQEKIAEIETT